MIRFKEALLRRDQLIDLLSVTEHDLLPDSFDGKSSFTYTPVKYIETIQPNYYLGKVVKDEKGSLFVVTEQDTEDNIFYIEPIPKDEIKKDVPLITVGEVFALEKGDLPNITKKQKTTVGLFLFNYILLAHPFGDYFPYQIYNINIGKIEKDIASSALHGDIEDKQIVQYRRNLYYLSHHNELFVPSLSEKSMMGSNKVEAFKKEYIKNNPDYKDDPIKMAELEDKALAIDKEEMKNDPSYGFLAAKEGKSYDLCRKEMFLTSGMAKDFSGEKDYVFVEGSLDEGLSQSDLVIGANETRIGVYKRSVDTALGGEITEWLRRMFQEQAVVRTDCGTSRGKKTFITENNKDDYILRYIVVNGKTILVDKNNIKQYIGKEVTMRSPGYCEESRYGSGVCSVCAGHKYIVKLAEAEQMSITMEMTKPGSAFLSESMSAMHGSKTQVLDITNLDDYVI